MFDEEPDGDPHGECASKLLRQRYQGKNYKVSADAVISMGKRAKRGEQVELVAP